MPITTHRLTAFATFTLALLASPISLRAQSPPDDEAHAEIRKDVADEEKKPDARESKVPGEQAKDRADDQQKPATKKDVSRDAAAERGRTPSAPLSRRG